MHIVLSKCYNIICYFFYHPVYLCLYNVTFSLFQLSIISKDNRDRLQVAVVLVARELAHYKLEERLYSYENENGLLGDILEELGVRGLLREGILK